MKYLILALFLFAACDTQAPHDPVPAQPASLGGGEHMSVSTLVASDWIGTQSLTTLLPGPMMIDAGPRLTLYAGGQGFRIDTHGLLVIAQGLPTSDPGIPGALYRDGPNVMISVPQIQPVIQ